MSEKVIYEPGFAWCCAWSNGSPRPFLIIHHLAGTRRDAIARFLSSWEPGATEPKKAWQRAYRDGARCVRVGVYQWGARLALAKDQPHDH